MPLCDALVDNTKCRAVAKTVSAPLSVVCLLSVFMFERMLVDSTKCPAVTHAACQRAVVLCPSLCLFFRTNLSKSPDAGERRCQKSSESDDQAGCGVSLGCHGRAGGEQLRRRRRPRA